MKLSIITVTYNNIDGLRKTIESVIHQSFCDYEWIIIDGASKDGSRDLIEQTANTNKYILLRWVSEPDSGIYNAMNKGITMATGEFCQFLNAGDTLYDNNILKKVFSSDEVFADVNYGQQWCVRNGEIVEKRGYPNNMSLSFIMRSPLGHQATFFRTSVIKNHPYREQYKISGDRAFFMELYVSGFGFNYLDYPIVLFDTDGIGSSPKTLDERRRQFYDIKREFFSDQMVKEIERLLSVEDEFSFVVRTKPLFLMYRIFKKLQSIRSRLKYGK